jgi:hypothetical protein
VLAVGIIARFQPHGMARALFATALAQALVAVIALIFGLGSPWSGPGEILALNGFFVALFLGSALLFRHAAREQPPASIHPSAWKRNSANFAFTEFSEVRIAPVLYPKSLPDRSTLSA